jgi:hypothetical protein
MLLSSANEGLSRRTRRAQNQRFEFIKGSSTSQLQPTHVAFPESPPISEVSSKKRGKQKTAAAELESVDASTTNTIPPPAPRKRRKTATDSAPDDTTETVPSVQPALDPSESISAQNHGRTTRSSRRKLGPSTTALPAASDLLPKPRRVTLLVTHPENAVEQLLQRSQDPLPSPLDVHPDPAASELRARAKTASVMAEKRAELRQSSCYLPLDRNKERRRGPPDEPERHVDTWDVILKAIEIAYRPEPRYIAVTRDICEAVRTRTELSLYGQATQSRLMRGTAKTKGSKKQRDDPDTTRRKKLAKATVELVIDHWKRVVLASVIRVFWVVLIHSRDFFLVCP